MQTIQLTMRGGTPLGVLGPEGYIIPYDEFEKGWHRRNGGTEIHPLLPYVRHLLDFSRIPAVTGDAAIRAAVGDATPVGSVALNKITGGVNGVGAEVIYDVQILEGYFSARIAADPDRYRISIFSSGKLRAPLRPGQPNECYGLDILAAGVLDTVTGSWVNTNPPVKPDTVKVTRAMKNLSRRRKAARERIAAQAPVTSVTDTEIAVEAPAGAIE